MTQERKCFVFAADISAVRILCNKCAGALIYPIAKLSDRQTIAKVLSADCQYCGAASGFVEGTRPCSEVVGFCDTLGNQAKNLAGLNVELSLQVECEDEK